MALYELLTTSSGAVDAGHHAEQDVAVTDLEVIRALLRGGCVEFHGEVINLHQGRLSFVPPRSAIPIYVASNGPLGQRVAGATADGAIMEASSGSKGRVGTPAHSLSARS
jgi:alkanesulfonate monooxygenase SsuD/methylene tetrahydromethanopterin reductase-like flavin-dependent oxidoreductase (luciferase family)